MEVVKSVDKQKRVGLSEKSQNQWPFFGILGLTKNKPDQQRQ